MAYNTGNPIGSTNAKDLSDNAENLDYSTNDLINKTWTDRLGVIRPTLQAKLDQLGFDVPIAYESGLEFTELSDRTKTVEEDGVVYAPLQSKMPFTTTGTWGVIGVSGDNLKFFTIQSKVTPENIGDYAVTPSNVTDYAVTSGNIGEYSILIFNSLNDALISEIPKVGDVIYVKERSIGYGGASIWYAKTTSSLTINNFNTATSIADSAVSLELEDKSNPEASGARGDGVFDNVSFFNFADGSGLTFEFDSTKTYATSGTINLTNGTRFNGNWASIILLGTNALGTVGSNSYIGEFDVDGEERDHTAALLTIASPSENAEIGDIKFRNVRGTGPFQTYDIVIPMYGAENFRVGNTEHYNIKHVDNGVVAGQGFVGGVYLVGFDDQVSNGKSYGIVGDIYGQDIKTVDGGSGVVQDSDLFRSFAETSTTEEFDIIFGNITGRDIGKRIVKAASCAGITVGNVFSYVSDLADGGLTMHATVECLGTAIDWKFGRIGNEGPNTRVVWFQGCSGCSTGDIYNGWGSIAAIFGGGSGAVASECSVGNITGRMRDGDHKGTGVYLFNADGCTTGNVTGDFEWSVLSYEDNTGVNTVGDVNAIAKFDIRHGETHVGKFALDVTKLSFVERPITLGGKFVLTSSKIITDGARTIDIVGVIDGDLGDFKIYRINSSGGIDTDFPLITTDGGSASGDLKGSVYAEVNNTILGSATGVPGKSFIYLDGLNLEMGSVSLNVTTPTRGATGFNLWFDGCNGHVSRVSVRASYTANSKIEGNVTVDKLENLTAGSDFTLVSNVNAMLVEKRVGNTVTGAVNTPTVIDTTRP